MPSKELTGLQQQKRDSYAAALFAAGQGRMAGAKGRQDATQTCNSPFLMPPVISL